VHRLVLGSTLAFCGERSRKKIEGGAHILSEIAGFPVPVTQQAGSLFFESNFGILRHMTGATITNTLAICGLARSDYDSDWVAELKKRIERKLSIVHWALLPSFGRILTVFEDVASASQARLIIMAMKPPYIRVYYAENTHLEHGDKAHLKLPDAGRLWLISPPASPPAEWEPAVEAEPNRETHFDPIDLKQALQRVTSRKASLPIGDVALAAVQDAETATGGQGSKVVRRLTLHEPPKLTLDTSVGDGSQAGRSPSPHCTPTIVVEWDDDDEVLPTPDRPSLGKTERPPMSI
jgi:hypothetical protein